MRAPARLLLLAGLLGLGALSLTALRLPDPPPAKSPRAAFSARRALHHVEVLCANGPRPVGSRANAQARAYLVERLRALGLQPTLQPARLTGWPAQITLTNILARRAGTGGRGKALLLMAHYDSAARGPGASDDGSGVAVILETLRALQHRPPLARDLIVLISDAEEVGLHGARAFLEDHSWAQQVGVAVNLEARGSRGPSIMFQTSAENGWLVRQLAACLPRPCMSSLTGDVYRRMPNDTDLTPFLRAGVAGVNFAFIGGVEDYHQASDTPAHLDPRTLQHHGEHALAVVARLGQLDLRPADAEGDRVYFDLLGRVVVHYPVGWALPLILLLTGVVLWPRRQAPWGTTVLAACVQLLVAAVAAGAAWLQWWLVDPQTDWPQPVHTSRALLAAACGLALLAQLCGLWLLRRRPIAAIARGAALPWLALGWITTFALPGGSFLFAWPLLGLLAPARGRWRTLLIGAVPLMLLVPPLVVLLTDALTLAAGWLLAALVGLALGLLVAPLRALTGEVTPVREGHRRDRLGS